jgi:hypothetical protein
MRDEYDFSGAVQGKFYRPAEDLEIPVYLDRETALFYRRVAQQKNLDVTSIIQSILRKEMDLLKEII